MFLEDILPDLRVNPRFPHRACDAHTPASPGIEPQEDSPESKSPAKRQRFAGLGQNRNRSGFLQLQVSRPDRCAGALPARRTGAA
ncbi:hypothetical protein [Burkholderia lata]|uniref:hypothetical protein n=1 Tax=Burkholderia lata (strain ATCC 17760 / DSM 23089 / LMG 22485 / NCIMB 9086 / R18194 / 383) TaxID=482957 RepID=UPI00158191FD|nr:hypothetical protein [Burkholderia lata]